MSYFFRSEFVGRRTAFIPPDWYEKVSWKHPPVYGKKPKLPEKPLKTMEEWFDLVKREYFGIDVAELMGYPWGIRHHVASPYALRAFTFAIGDTNPLWLDPVYAAKTRYGCNITPPGFVLNIRYPATPECGPPAWVFDTMTYYAGFDSEWYDVMRLGDRFKSQKVHSDTVRKESSRSGVFGFLYAETAIWNQHGKLINKMTGWSARIPRPKGAKAGSEGGTLLYERDQHVYSDEELDNIDKLVKGEERRGAETRYWEDVEVGDKLTPVVKTPMNLGEFAVFQMGHGAECYEIEYLNHSGKKKEYATREIKHPITGWIPGGPEHDDILICKARAFPLPFDYGMSRSAQSGHILTNWMGDEGFLWKSVNYMRRPLFYTDAIYWTGEVVKKYKCDEGCAVDIDYRATNQLGTVVTPGKCTVLLPSSKDGPVKLPIPH